MLKLEKVQILKEKVHLAIELISTVRSVKQTKSRYHVEWQNPRLMVRQSSECGLLSDRQSQTLFQRPRSPSPESRRGVPQFQTRVGRQRGRTFVPWRRGSICLKMSPTQFCLSSFDNCWLLFPFQSNQTFRVEVNLCWGRFLVRDRWGDLARSPREWNSPKTVGRNHCRLLRRKNRGRTRDKIRTQAKYDLQGDWYWSQTGASRMWWNDMSKYQSLLSLSET